MNTLSSLGRLSLRGYGPCGLTIVAGRYASASEVVRDGLRALEDREKLKAVKLDALRSEIQRGADSGAGIPAKAIIAAVRKRIARSGTAPGRR